MQVAAVPPPNNGELQLSGILGLHVANASPNTARSTLRYHRKINFNVNLNLKSIRLVFFFKCRRNKLFGQKQN